jgi:hypothetical protein
MNALSVALPRISHLRRFVLGCLLSLVTALAATAADAPPAKLTIPATTEILKTLRPEHPRLLATRSDFDRARKEVVTDTKRSAWWTKIQGEADRILRQEPMKYEIPDGLRLLGVSRNALHRSYILGLAWQITRDRKYADRLAREMTAVVGFKDWNPRHFLDTSEMAHAVGIAYDWCFDAFAPEQREAIQKAMISLALEPARQIHRDAATKGGWPTVRHNWNQVCNGGITLGALAIAEAAPEIAAELIGAAAVSVQIPMAEFAPDGAWSEGPAYWNYATIYNVAMLASLTTALGTDFGLSGLPGFAETGFFPLHITGPLARTFNFADGRDNLLRAPHMHWLANRFQKPQLARYQRDAASPHPLDILWYDAELAQRPTPAEPLDRYFRGAELVTLRSAWPTPTSRPGALDPAIFVGFKGGNNQANHSHLDLGSFVLDALGIRWAADAGAEDYSAPGYFGAQRWTYYKTRAEGHNTLVLGPDTEPDQDPKAAAPIVRFASRPEEALAIADLSAAYARHARRVQRGIALQANRTRLMVQDEIEADPPTEVLWFLHTFAEVELQDRQATLTHGKSKLWAAILSPAGAKFDVMPTQPLPSSPQADNLSLGGGRKLVIRLPATSKTRLSVVFVPLPGETQAPDPASIPLKPLSDWN